MRIIARMNIGGPAVQVSGLMRGLCKSEFEHRLYTGSCGANEADYLDTVATDVKAFRVYGFGRRINFVGDISAFLNLVTEIRRFKPHIIHTHTAKAGFLGRTASIFSFHRSIRVHTFHGHLLNGYFSSSKRMLVVIAEKLLAWFTHHLLAVGDKVRRDLLGAGIGSIEMFGLMPPGLGIGKLSSKSCPRNQLGLSVDGLQCAFVGRVTQIKRPDRFLDVVAEIKRRNLDVEFFLAGEGELSAYCSERVRSEKLPVKLLGWQTDIERVLSSADIVILTSDNEGTPLSLIQAGMAGLPVVTTNVGSVSEIVLHGVTGLVVGSTVQELANALEKLAGDAGLRARMGSAAQEFTMANFGVNRLVHDHEQLYKRLISNRAKS
jgi:glycosyltransferase involved in cell wall biosynthesis